MSFITTMSKLILIVGGINWGLIGVVHFDMIAAWLGEMSAAACTAYAMMGSAALWLLFVMLCDALPGPYTSTNSAP